MQDQQSDLEWRDGVVPVSTRFDDPYFSLENGFEETRHTFLAGNDLPARFADGFHIAELGFGTGLNALVTRIAWEAAGAPGRLYFTSFEAFPIDAAAMEQALSAFPALSDIAHPLLTGWAAGQQQIDLGAGMELRVIIGDARETLPAWSSMADAWFLDGFAPAKNPELWGDALMQAVADHTKPGGSAATYTAAGHVRRALQAAGFAVDRCPGFGRKRHMTIARKP